MSSYPKISVVILAKNEEHVIGRCLAAAVRISEDVVVVLDEGSADATESICREAGVKVIRHPWQGYAATKNFGVSQAKYDWILSLDADEVADDTLVSQITRLDPVHGTVYLLNRLTYFGSHPVRWCGWYPEWNKRLYHRHQAMWDQSLVHEKLTSSEDKHEVRLPGILHHYSFRGEEDMKQKFDRYAHLRAMEWVRSAKTPSRIKKTFGPLFRFFKTYVIKLGFLEGSTGWTIARNEYLMKKKELTYFAELAASAKN